MLLVQVQLILPEALKLLPLYSLALHKSNMLRPEVRADDRSAWLAGVVGAAPQRIMGLLHPRLFAVHQLLVSTLHKWLWEQSGRCLPCCTRDKAEVSMKSTHCIFASHAGALGVLQSGLQQSPCRLPSHHHHHQ